MRLGMNFGPDRLLRDRSAALVSHLEPGMRAEDAWHGENHMDFVYKLSREPLGRVSRTLRYDFHPFLFARDVRNFFTACLFAGLL